MFYPRQTPLPQSRETCQIFDGLNRGPRPAAGELADMENLTAEHHPVLAPRKPRGIVARLTNPQGLLGKDSLCYADGATLFYGGAAVEGITLSTLEAMEPKQLVAMGAYILVFPDKVYFNTQDWTDRGHLENTREVVCEPGSGVRCRLCRRDGSVYEAYTTGPQAPQDPGDGDLWLDTGGSVHSLKTYSETMAAWSSVPSVYLRLDGAGIGLGFSEYDGVTITGLGEDAIPGLESQLKALCGGTVLYGAGDNYLVIPGILDREWLQEEGTVTVKRLVPDMDFVTECGNRLWGCKYGLVDGKAVNEIYACALGDFKNWNRFLGLSTDSYAASRGSDGPWTGAATYLGSPLFFKENTIERVYPAPGGAHQIVETHCQGVQKGSAGSCAQVGGRLFYKGPTDVCVFDGSLPVPVSRALGGESFRDAAGGSLGDKYYLSMKDSGGDFHLFVFDSGKGLWHREDGIRARFFARVDGELFFVDGDNRLMAATGREGEPEGPVSWMAQTGKLGFSQAESKYISRLNLRLRAAPGSEVEVFLRYDSQGPWEKKGSIRGEDAPRSVTLPIRPRRCDHLELRLQGKGDCRVYSLSKITETGSDVFWE